MADLKQQHSEIAAKKPLLTPGRILALLMAAALVIRVLAALTRPMIQLDETAYVRMAENLGAGNSMLDISGMTTTHFSPLLPLFIAGTAAVVRDYVVAAFIVVTVFGSLMLLPTYLLGKELASTKVGLMAAALLAVTPLMVDYSSRVYSESVYIFFLLLGIVFGHHMLRGCRVACSILAGAALGMAYLANPSAVFYVMALVVLALIVAYVRGIWRPLAKAFVFFLIFFLLYAVPYVLYLHGELGKWTYSGKIPGNIYASTHGLRVNTLEWEKDVMGLTDNNRDLRVNHLENEGDPASTFLRHPLQGAKIFVQQSYVFYNEELQRTLPLWLLPLLGLGLFARGWSRRRAAGVGYLLIMMAPALLIVTMYAYNRFFMPFVPMVLVWGGEGWLRLDEWGDETIGFSISEEKIPRWRRLAPWVIGAAVILPLLAYSAVTVKKQTYPIGYKDAGLMIRQQAGTDKRIMSREYSAAYYSGGTAVLLPYADYDSTTEYARNKNVDYLVIGKAELSDWRPTLERMLDDSSSPPDWQYVGSSRPGTDQETLIFQLAR